VERDFARYLECGVLAHGFARVRCESCKDELLVAFSCKGRGVCPSCSAKRAHVTAMHLVEQVLPHVPFRQWTLAFPHRVRWVLLKDVGLLSDVLTVFLRAAGEGEASVAPQAGARQETRKERTGGGDWAGLRRRSFAVEVLACVRCGGRRRELAYVKEAGGVRAIQEHVGLPTAGARLAPARGPPQAAWC
jgi:hypothetical protein